MELAVAIPFLLAHSPFGGLEIVLILAVVLILFFAGPLAPWSHRLGRGLHEFWKATKVASEEGNSDPKEGGFAYEAITHDNRTAEFVHPHRSELSEQIRAMILFFAQGFGVGRIPFAPGTFGSLVGVLWFALLVTTKRYEWYLAGALGGVVLSVWLCGVAEKILKQKDPSSVVLDEIAAIPFCFLPWVTQLWLRQHQLPALDSFLTGRALFATLAIFVLFRIFDIWKPWPVRQSQSLPGGWGVTLDDVLAAIYVALLSLLFVR